MSTFRNPVGPQPPAVYWRRRLFVLLGLVAVIVVVILIVSRLGADAPTTSSSSAPSEAPAETSAPPTEESATPVAGALCDPATLTVTPVVDSNTYAADQLPQLSFSLVNTGTVACTFNAGTTQQTYEITSGEELYWSSKDCETGAVDADILLEPNVAQSPAAIAWDRTRSSADTCAGDRPVVPAGGATYNLSVTVGAVTSAAPVSFLLN